MADDLDDFLNNDPAGSAPSAEPAVETPAPAEAEAPEPAVEEEDAPVPETGTIPVSVLLGERNKRKDWKEKALLREGEAASLKAERDALKAERDAVRAELEAAKKAPPPVVQSQEPQRDLSQMTQDERLWNHTLNTSEMLLRDKIGDEAVDKVLSDYHRYAAANPALAGELMKHSGNPFKWVHSYVEKQRALDEIGTDPAAYQARMKEQWLAEYQASLAKPADDGGIAPVSRPAAPSVTLPKSLTTTRSAAPRSAPTVTGDVPLSELFPQH